MTVKISVTRNAKHPQTQKPGFDLLHIFTDTQDELDFAIDSAEKKFWQVWISGFKQKSNQGGAVMYKPCDFQSEWQDSPDNPHPGNIRSCPTSILK